MYGRRRTYKRRRPRRARRSTITRRRPMRMVRGVPQKSLFTTKLKHYMETWTFSSASTAGFWRYYTFTPTNLGTQYDDFRFIFDEYKISGVLLELRPNYDDVIVDNVNASFRGGLGTFHYAIDTASQTTPVGVLSPTTVNYFLEQSQNIKSSKTDTVKRIYYKPQVSSQVQGGGLQGRAEFAPWLKCGTADSTVYNGVHLFIQPPDTLNPLGFLVKYDIFVTAYLQFRGNA